MKRVLGPFPAPRVLPVLLEEGELRVEVLGLTAAEEKSLQTVEVNPSAPLSGG